LTLCCGNFPAAVAPSLTLIALSLATDGTVVEERKQTRERICMIAINYLAKDLEDHLRRRSTMAFLIIYGAHEAAR
jgi:hypothetical protein